MTNDQKKYRVILIDPPWPFRTFSSPDEIATLGEKPYECMTLGQIAAIPMRDYMARNCAVFIWENDSLNATDWLRRAWGLRLGTANAFIWMKLKDNQLDLYDPPPFRLGMGYYTRKQAEVCHLLVKGQMSRKDMGVRQVIQAPRRQHSRKPDEIYARIETMYDGPYLEMFARQTRLNWDAMGDEVGKFKGEG